MNEFEEELYKELQVGQGFREIEHLVLVLFILLT